MPEAAVEGDNVRVTDPDQLRLLAVHAHPDDESSKGAATMAKYVAEGARVLVATCTGGERGSVLNPAMDRPEIAENITAVRAAEMERAREILGVRQVFLGYVDSGLPEGDPLPPLPEGCFAAGDLGTVHRRVEHRAAGAVGERDDQDVGALLGVPRHRRRALARLVVGMGVHTHEPQGVLHR